MKKEFGFYPEPLKITAGPVTISPLPEFEETVNEVLAYDGIDNNWIYAPPSSRLFGLRKTHFIEHTEATEEKQLDFHIWALSFFVGMRLALKVEENSFVDATPLKPGKLVDFVLIGSSLTRAIGFVDCFWKRNPDNHDHAEILAAAVNALFLAQNPQNLQFERFLYLYMAIDACNKLTELLRPCVYSAGPHKYRIEQLSKQFCMTVPAWAKTKIPTDPNGSELSSEVSRIRNSAFHEALYMGAPLGFAIHEDNRDTKKDERNTENLVLEMKAFVCRLLVALICSADNSYVRSATNTRSIFGLDLNY